MSLLDIQLAMKAIEDSVTVDATAVKETRELTE
jgi:hypothetical protein